MGEIGPNPAHNSQLACYPLNARDQTIENIKERKLKTLENTP